MSRNASASIDRQLEEAIGEHRKGRLKPAARLYRAVLARDPRNVAALEMLGMAHGQQGELGDAEQCFRRALALAPNSTAAIANLANALRLQGRHAEAEPLYARAVAGDPARADLHLNHGVALFALERHGDAMRAFGRAADLAPGDVAGHYNVGRAALASGRPEVAITALEAAAALASDDRDVQAELAAAYRRTDRIPQALLCYERAGLTGAGETRPGHMVLAHLYARVCDWPRSAAHAELAIRGLGNEASSPPEPFSMLTLVDDPALQLRAARLEASRVAPAGPPAARPAARAAPERLRIAYVSGDYNHHPLSFLMAGVIERHARARFEIIGVSTGPEDSSAVGRRIRGAFDELVDATNMSSAELVSWSRARGIDIAVNLSGYTEYSRNGAFARRLAGVQVNYIGYPATMGADWMDYVLADRIVIPPGCDGDFDEAVVRFPDCFQANDDRTGEPGTPPARSDLGLPEDAVVLASFNNSAKIGREMFKVWMDILAAVPQAVLWLVAPFPEVKANLRAAAAAAGIAPARLIFADRRLYAEHLARHACADLFLDTLPYNAGATASAALWCGVPVLTYAGRAMPARMGASLLTACGLTDLIAENLDEYAAKAIALARAPAALQDARARTIAARASPLFDTARFTRHLERAYEQMHRIHLSGEPPRSFDVPPL